MAYNISEAVPIEIKQVDSLKITGFSVDVKNSALIIQFDQLSGGDVINSPVITLTEEAYATAIAPIYNVVKNRLYDEVETQLGLTGTVV